ncbi:DoxX family protein [Scandinavium sp.]|uniref:DoxX family protein n=1 Tax=Scandinavium sp. TaxID=2830653 RepID=UPI00289F2A80|nr:DoxX family protein [Scandinavium sp.]
MKLFTDCLPYIMAAIYLIGFFVNAFPGEKIRDNYRRWGYPAKFYYVTAAVEMITVILLSIPDLVTAGFILSMVLNVAALLTLYRSRELKDGIAALIFILVSAAWILVFCFSEIR